MKNRRIGIFGHQTSLAIELEYWDWLYEIAAKIGVTIKDPYPIYRCPGGMVPMRDGNVWLGWQHVPQRWHSETAFRGLTVLGRIHGRHAAPYCGF